MPLNPFKFQNPKAVLGATLMATAAVLTSGGVFSCFRGSSEDPGRLPAAFFPPEQLRTGDQPRGFTKILPAVVQFVAQPSECATKPCVLLPCTGVFISNQGHFLTALHCLEKIDLFKSESWNEVGLTLRSFDPKLAARNPFQVRFFENGKPGAQVAVQVAGAGLGYSTSFSHVKARGVDSKRYLEAIESGIGPVNDFVVLKLPLSGTPCVAVGPAAVPGLWVWSLTYPSQTERKDGYDSAGHRELYTEGKVTRGVAENQAFIQAIATLSGELRRDMLELHHGSLDREGTFASTLDAVAGSSGSPVFNHDGLLVGVVNSTEDFGGDPKGTFYSGSVRAVSMSRIMQGLKGAPVSAEFFRCR